MRPIWIVGIIIGILLIYLGMFGLEGFGFNLSLTGSSYKEDFTTLNDWSVVSGFGGTPTISPASQAYFHAPAGTFGNAAARCGMMTKVGGLFPTTIPNQYTIEVRMSIDDYGAGSGTATGAFTFALYDGSYWIPVQIQASQISVGTQTLTTSTDTSWHTWTMVCDHTGTTWDLWKDNTKLNSFQYIAATGISPKFTLDCFGAASGPTDVHVDWVYMDAGLFPPGSGPTTWTITASAGAGGSISPSGAVTVNDGASQTFAISANNGYSISSVIVDGNNQGTITSYTFSNVHAAHTISASFTSNGGSSWTIQATAGNGGSISPSGSVTVQNGASQTFTITASGGYSISQVFVDGNNQGAISSYTFSNVQAGHTISASFTSNGGSTWTIQASAGSGGSISPSGAVTVSDGGSQTFTISASSGYSVSSVQVDGQEQGDIGSYTFYSVHAAHTISVSFTGGGGVDIIALLKADIHKYATPIEAFGGIITLVSSIMLFIPTKKIYAAYSPPY